MNNLAVAIVDGNLTRDPETRQAGASTVTKFSIAVNDTYKDRKNVSFFEVETWGRQAENCGAYLKKGAFVTVTGRLTQDRWEKDGTKYERTKIVASSVRFGKKPEQTPEQGLVDTFAGDDVPF